MTSYGFIEITGVVAAIDALDIMCKTADVSLASWERKLGGRLVTMIIEGSVEDVAQAISTASANAIKKPVSYGVIANPHEEIRRLVALSASRWNKRLKEAREESPEDVGTTDTCRRSSRRSPKQLSEHSGRVLMKEEKNDTGSIGNGRDQGPGSVN